MGKKATEDPGTLENAGHVQLLGARRTGCAVLAAGAKLSPRRSSVMLVWIRVGCPSWMNFRKWRSGVPFVFAASKSTKGWYPSKETQPFGKDSKNSRADLSIPGLSREKRRKEAAVCLKSAVAANGEMFSVGRAHLEAFSEPAQGVFAFMGCLREFASHSPVCGAEGQSARGGRAWVFKRGRGQSDIYFEGACQSVCKALKLSSFN